jgi:catechol-2,3-dioxygenase
MTLNHINLVVSNVEEAIKLFEAYFNFKCIEIKGAGIIAVLKGKNDFTLVLMKSKDEAPAYPEAFHIGFLQESKEAVFDLHNKLKSGSIDLGKEPGRIRGGFGFYFVFDNIMIEVSS